MNFNRFLLSLLIGSALIFLCSYNVATAEELSDKDFGSKYENNNLLRENFHLNSSNSSRNKDNKSSSEQLLGTWAVTSVDDSGNKTTSTIMYSDDGTYILLATLSNGDWYVFNTGTWELTDNVLYENSEAGENLEGSIKFISNDELIYQGDNGETKWQRVGINTNLSEDQLIGTWSIVVQKRIEDTFIDYIVGIATLIELNSDGTFRYKSIDARYSIAQIVTKRSSGTWTYINPGYADGFLLLKDSQGQLSAFSSINWNEDGSFLNMNRSTYDRDSNVYTPGIIEEFSRTDLIIDQTF